MTHPSSPPYPMTTLHCYAYAPPPSSKPPPMAAYGLLALSYPSSMTTTHPSPPFPPLLPFPYSSSDHAPPPFRALLFRGKPNSRPFLSPSVFALGSLVTAHESPTTPPMAAVDAASSRVQPPIDAHFHLPPNTPWCSPCRCTKRIKLSSFVSQNPDSLASFLLEDLLIGEEAVVAAAAAEAVALAKAAVNVAKGAALLAGGDWMPSMGNLNDTRDGTADMNELATKTFSCSPVHENHVLIDGYDTLMEDLGLQNYACSENSLLEMEQPEKVVAVRSVRQLERKNIKERTAEKPCANFISAKGGTSSRKKRSAVEEIDYSDPLRYLRNTTSTSKLLTATEELEFSEGIQDLLKLERLYDELTERFGGRPTFAQWASAAGTNQRMLRQRLNYGILCKDKMIKSNIRLVIPIAKNYQGAGMNLQDLVQEGCRGLVRGAEKFDASKGFKFSTYAHWWIKQAVRKSLSDQSRTIRLPFRMVEAKYRVREAKKQIYSETGRHPDNKELAEATGLSMKRLNAVLLTPKAPRSLDQKIGINQNLKPSEVIADPEAETAEDILIKQFMKQDLNKVLDTLSPRERQVIRCRYGLEDGRMRTLQEIGELMGVSRERIRQIESCAFRKLKNEKRTGLLRQYFIY